MEVGDINSCMNYLVPGAGVEPARCKAPRDFKSLVSTSSTTRAIHVNIVFFGTVQRFKELYGRLMDWPCIVNNLLRNMLVTIVLTMGVCSLQLIISIGGLVTEDL